MQPLRDFVNEEKLTVSDISIRGMDSIVPAEMLPEIL
jgi:hypothetical protein